MNITETTLGYIEWNDCFLMLYRNKKENDPNEGKWIGIGGHLEDGESPDECFVREVREETGIILTNFTQRGVIDFISDTAENERMYLYSASVDSPNFGECNEGVLKWISKNEILNLNLWEGDRHFLIPLINGETDIRMRLEYKGWDLVDVKREQKN